MNKTLRSLTIVLAILFFAAIGANVYSVYISHDDPVQVVISIALMLVCAYGIYYTMAGCKKVGGALYFKVFLNILAITQLLLLLGHAAYTDFSVILLAVIFGCLAVLSVAADLGKQKSLTLVGVQAFCALIRTILDCKAGTAVMVVTALFLSLGAVVLVLAKYADKASRGSK